MWHLLSLNERINTKISDKSVVFSGYTGFLHQYNWPPLYNWNIIESGVKHHKSSNQPLVYNLLSCVLKIY